MSGNGWCRSDGAGASWGRLAGTRVVPGSIARMAEASSPTVGWSNSVVSDSSMPRATEIRRHSSAARMDWPPSSKKWSCTPTSAMPSTSAKVPATCASSASRGGTGSRPRAISEISSAPDPSEPSRNACRHRCRCTFPLDVLGSAPGPSSATASGAKPATSATALRIAEATRSSASAGASASERSTSHATTTTSSPPASTPNAALPPGRSDGCAPSAACSRSCGYTFRPRRMRRSFSRPVT